MWNILFRPIALNESRNFAEDYNYVESYNNGFSTFFISLLLSQSLAKSKGQFYPIGEILFSSIYNLLEAKKLY